LKENEPKKPQNIFGTKKVQVNIFEKQTPAYSLGALLLGLAKFIYCAFVCQRVYNGLGELLLLIIITIRTKQEVGTCMWLL